MIELQLPPSLPHSQESERAVLAAVLLEGGAVMQRIADRVREEDFFLERHQRIWSAMTELAGGAIDLRTLQALLQQRGHLDAVGGLAYLAGLDVDLPDLGSLDAYVDIVRDRALRRRLVLAGSELVRNSLDGADIGGIEALARGELALRRLAEESMPRTAQPFGEVLGEVLEQMEDAGGRGMVGLSTGWADVDAAILGLRRGNLLILAGGPGSGKTSWVMQVIAQLASHGHAAGIFSLEMTREELALRVLCQQADISHDRMLRGFLSQRQWQVLIQTARRIMPLPVFIDDDGAIQLPQLLARARRWRAERQVQLIVIDHLQLMSAGGRWSNRNEELGSISRTLKGLAKELELPVILLSQINRQPDRRGGDHRPQLSDLRDSGAPAADGDVVMFLYRDELYNAGDPSVRGLAELLVRKNRNGSTGTVEMVFLGETFSFRQMARDYHAQHQPHRPTLAPPSEGGHLEGRDPF